MGAQREEGIIKMELKDSSEATIIRVQRWRTNTAFPDAAKTDLSKAPVLPYGVGRTLKEDDIISISLKADAVDTLDYADMNDCVNIPITRKILPTKQIIEDVLECNDMKLASAPTTVVGEWVEILKYRIPAQQEVKLGQLYPAEAPNSHILIIPMDDST